MSRIGWAAALLAPAALFAQTVPSAGWGRAEWRQRAQALRQEIIRNPREAARRILDPGRLTPQAVAADPGDLERFETHQTRTVLIADREDGLGSTNIYEIDTPEGRIQAYQDSADAPPAQCGQTLAVSGYRLGDVMLATRVTPLAADPQPNCYTVGEHRVAVILVNITGLPQLPVTVEQAREQFFSSSTMSASTFYQENSYGKASITGDVYGPITLNESFTCEQTSVLLSRVLSATASQVDYSQYTHVHLLHPNLPGGCGWAGLGTVGCGTISVPGRGSQRAGVVWQVAYRNYLLRELVHELGHNFGLGHSRSTEFPGELLGPDRLRAIYSEYGDGFSSMGGVDAYHFSAPHKAQLGWLKEGEDILPVSEDAEVDLLPLESAQPGVKALRIRRNLGRVLENIWVEYRQPLGLFDSRMSRVGWQGAMLHYQTAETGLYAELVDASPRPPGSPASSFNDVVLGVGRTWRDPYTGLTIEVVSGTSDALRVRVRYEKPCVQVTWPAETVLSPLGGIYRPTLAAEPGCTLQARANSSWLEVRPEDPPAFDVRANTGSYDRDGSVTVARQTRFLRQQSPRRGSAVRQIYPPEGTIVAGQDTPFMLWIDAPGGVSKLGIVDFRLGPESGAGPACHIRYAQPVRLLFLMDDSGAAFAAGQLFPGSSATLKNSSCEISGLTVSQPSTYEVYVSFWLNASASFTGEHTMMAGSTQLTDEGSPVLSNAGSLSVKGGCEVWPRTGRYDMVSRGGALSVYVNAPSSCSWTVRPLSDWITVTGSANKTGSLFAQFSATPNPGTEPRSGLVRLQNFVFTVFQAGSGSAGGAGGATVSFDAQEMRLGRLGGSGTVYFKTNLAASEIVATSTASWLRFSPVTIDPILGGVLRYSFDTNVGPQRGAEILINGFALAFVQDAGGGTEGADYLISTYAGDAPSGDGGPANEARLLSPGPVAYDATGHLYIAETETGRIRKVAPDGLITTLAAVETEVRGLAAVAQGVVYFSEAGRLRRIGADGAITTLASGLSGAAGLAVDGAGAVYVAEESGHRVRRVSPEGALEVVAGSGVRGSGGDGELARSARLNAPRGVAVDARGTVYIADTGNSALRKVEGGLISTLYRAEAGNVRNVAVSSEGTVWLLEADRLRILETEGEARTVAEGELGSGLAITPSGGAAFVDAAHDLVRSVGVEDQPLTLAGREPGLGVGDGGPALTAYLRRPQGAALAADGSLLIADTRNHRIRRIDASGLITTVAGTGEAGTSGDGGPATEAQLNQPAGLAVDASGNVYIGELGGGVVRKVTPEGVISTLAAVESPATLAVDTAGIVYAAGAGGERVRRIAPDGSVSELDPASEALRSPAAVAAGPDGTLHVSDTGSRTVQSMNAAGGFRTVAGNGLASGDSGDALHSAIGVVTGLAVSRNGDLVLVDAANGRVLLVRPDGSLTVAAGAGPSGEAGDGGPAWAARLYQPAATAMGTDGAIYIVEPGMNRVRVLRR